MVPFKEVFLGNERREYDRATSAQRCMRAGGKHNDLELVGFTPRHHTFFEMLGNFSFGSYFKEEAITYAWDYITNVLCLPVSRLRVTVYKDDEESRELWRKIANLPDSKILSCGEEDNFWSLGAKNGPCGPCTEIFYDTGNETGTEDDRWLEIWNLVFMQYIQSDDGVLKNLPRPAVDTGMGLERVASVVQGKSSNFQTDTFSSMMSSLDSYHSNNHVDSKVAQHVLVDHIRAAAFLIADGVFPSNVGRGYVLRRIVRRAVRYGNSHLGIKDPVMCKMIDSLIDAMGEAHREHLSQHRQTIENILRSEETSFFSTLQNGTRLLEQHFRDHSQDDQTVPASLVFKLYDTFGFPVDLTDVIVRERGLDPVDVRAVDQLMQKQRDRARKAWKGSGEMKVCVCNTHYAITSTISLTHTFQ